MKNKRLVPHPTIDYAMVYEKIEQMLLVEYKDNYADQFDISGFIITTEKTWKEFCDRGLKYFENNESETYQFGSDEWIEYRSAKEFFSCFKGKKLNTEDAEIIQELLTYDFSYPDSGLFFQKGFFPDILESFWVDDYETIDSR